MRRLLLAGLMFVITLISGLATAQEDAAQITHGPLSGEVSSDAVTLWARGSQPGTIVFEIADNADFSGDLISASVEASEEHDFIAETRVNGLEAGTQYY